MEPLKIGNITLPHRAVFGLWRALRMPPAAA